MKSFGPSFGPTFGPARDPIAELDADGVLVARARRVQLTRRERAVVRRLLDVAPDALSIPEFAHGLWPAGCPSEVGRRRALALLRRRLGAVGLALRVRPGMGYTLERSAWSPDPSTAANAASTASTIGGTSTTRTGTWATTRR